MTYVTAAYSSEGLSSSISSLARSSSADFTTTWSKPAACARAQSGRVGVVREAEDRDVRIRLDDVVGIDARDVADHEVGRRDRVGGDEAMARQHRLELPPEEEVDPCEQDRRHARSVERCAASVEPMSDRGSHFERGLELIRRGVLRGPRGARARVARGAARRSATSSRGSCTSPSRWYQAGRGNRYGCERQLEKAARRLGPYAPAHRGVDVAGVLAQVERRAGDRRRGIARARAARVSRTGGAKPDAQPPHRSEEEQQAEDDEDMPADDLEVAEVIAEPAERSHRRPEHDAGQDERNCEPERVGEQQQRSLRRPCCESAGEHERDARIGLTHGAAQIAKAAPSSTRRAAAARRRRAGPARRTLAAAAGGARTEAEHDEHEAGDLLERALADVPESAEMETPSATKTPVKPATNGTLRETARRPGDRTAAPPIVGQVPGDERQARTARRTTRSRRGTRAGSGRPRAQASKRASSSSTRRSSVGIERRAAGAAEGSRAAAPPPRGRAEHDRAAEHGDERQQPREQVEPVRRRARDDRRPERRDQLVLDLDLRVARARCAAR